MDGHQIETRSRACTTPSTFGADHGAMSSSSDDNSLKSGTYVIHSVQGKKEDERLIMIADGGEVKTRKDQMFKVLHFYSSIR